MEKQYFNWAYAACLLLVVTAASCQLPGLPTGKLPGELAEAMDTKEIDFEALKELPDVAIDALATIFYEWTINNAKKENKLVEDPLVLEQVNKVFKNIVEAAKRSKYSETANEFDWVIHVIKDDETKNAFAWPGGKVVVYTGMFQIAKNEAGLAAVLGHEMTHALARHAKQRLTQDVIAALPIAGLAAGTIKDPDTFDPRVTVGVMAALGGVSVGVDRAFSREREFEADEFGLHLAADAGYDPEGTIGFWARLLDPNCAQEDQLPEYLRGHPANKDRYLRVNDRMKEYLNAYQVAKDQGREPHGMKGLPGTPCSVRTTI